MSVEQGQSGIVAWGGAEEREEGFGVREEAAAPSPLGLKTWGRYFSPKARLPAYSDSRLAEFWMALARSWLSTMGVSSSVGLRPSATCPNFKK